MDKNPHGRKEVPRYVRNFQITYTMIIALNCGKSQVKIWLKTILEAIIIL